MKVLKVRQRNIDYSLLEASLKPVMGHRFRKNGYTHIQYQGRVYEGYVAPDAPVFGGTVWLKGHDDYLFDNCPF